MAQEKAHRELEEIAAAQDMLDERRRQGELNAQKLTMLLENEKSKYAYMARQLERESRAQLQEGAGFRRAVEVIMEGHTAGPRDGRGAGARQT